MIREVFQLINKEARIELECYHFAILNELMYLAREHQWLQTTQKERQPDIMFFLMDKHTIISESIMPKNLNLILIKLLDPTINFGEIQNLFVKQNHRNPIRHTQTVGNSTGHTGFFEDKFQGGQKMEREYLD